jgi:putative transposase
LYLKRYETVPLVQQGLGVYFPFYNEQRRHQSLQYQTPAQVYWSGRKAA